MQSLVGTSFVHAKENAQKYENAIPVKPLRNKFGLNLGLPK